MHDRYEAFRAFLSILTGMVVADCLSNFAKIRAAVRSVYSLDGTEDNSWTPFLLAILVVVYIWKNAHGILVTMFDKTYYDQIKDSRRHSFLGCLLMSFVVVSLSIVVRASGFVADGSDVFGRGWRLLLIAFVPGFGLLCFDVFRLALDGHWGRHKCGEWCDSFWSVWDEVRKAPAKRYLPAQFRRIWVAEDMASIVVFVIWLAIVGLLVASPQVEIWLTVAAFFILLMLNSVVDYWLNFNFFFSFLSRDREAALAAQETGGAPGDDAG